MLFRSLIEPVPRAALRPAGVPLGFTVNAAYFRDLVAMFDLPMAALVVRGSRECTGASWVAVSRAAREADVLLNISGMLDDEALLPAAPRRVYLDLDPAFNQLWHAQGIDMRFGGHTHFVTVGQNLGREGCAVPTCGLPWQVTLPPVVLADWPMVTQAPTRGLTTIANWRAYGSIEHDGVLHGQKCHALRPLMGLPATVGLPFELALAIHEDETRDLDALAASGWRLLDAVDAAGTPARYQAFIQSSTAEFGLAKSGYVVSRSGWVSDRSAAYLASGRPVIAQDTGAGEALPTGEGLFLFSDAEGVGAAVEAIQGDYARHARAARALAEAHFDSDRVLTRLLEMVDAWA